MAEVIRPVEDRLFIGAGRAAVQSAADLGAEAVVFDVLRACATITALLACPVQSPLWVSDSVEACWHARRHFWPDVLLGGERDSRPIPGFDFGNSPVEVLRRAAELAGRRVILTTSGGTRVLAAGPPGHTWVGSLTNLPALIERVRAWHRAGRSVLLVPVGGTVGDDPRSNEDLYVALYVLWQVAPRVVEAWVPELAARWERFGGEPDWPGVLRATFHGRELIDLGLGEDVTWIGTSVGLYPGCPVVSTEPPPVSHLAPVVWTEAAPDGHLGPARS